MLDQFMGRPARYILHCPGRQREHSHRRRYEALASHISTRPLVNGSLAGLPTST